ncbi:hypothetical protein GCM10027406_13840 [Leifsonia lichenia]
MFSVLALILGLLLVLVGFATIVLRSRIAGLVHRPSSSSRALTWMFSSVYFGSVGAFAIVIGLLAIIVGVTR